MTLKMLVRLLCLCVGLAITTSAPVEGPQCISSAVLDDQGHCVCPEGQIGDGYLCCADDSLSHCVIIGDPILESIYGVKNYIDFPCAHYVSRFSSTYKGRSCDITVLTSGTFVSKGFIFDNRISLEVSVDNGEPESLQIFQNKFETTGETVEDFLRGQGPRVVNAAGLNFSISFDRRENMWTIEGCDAQFKYRPNQGTSPLQRLTPGICVTSRSNVTRESATEGNLCNIDTNFDEGPYEYVEERLLADSIELYGEISERVDLDTPELRPVCRDVSESFENCSPSGKVLAMRHCASILTNSLVRLCLFYKGDVFNTFRDCLAAYCGKDRSACNRLKNNQGVQVCTSGLLECDQWVEREPEPSDQRMTEPSTLPQEEEVEVAATVPPQPPKEEEEEPAIPGNPPVQREQEINEPIYTPEPREDQPYTPEPREEVPYTPEPREEEPYTPEPREEEPYIPKEEEPYTPEPQEEKPYTPEPKKEEPYTPREEEPYTPQPRGEEVYIPEPKEEEPYTPEQKEEEQYTPVPREVEPYTPEEEEVTPKRPSQPEPSSPKSPKSKKGSGSGKSKSGSDKSKKSRSGSNKSKKSRSKKSKNSGSVSNKINKSGSNKSNKSGSNKSNKSGSNKSNKSAGSKSKGTKRSPKSLFSLKSVKIGKESRKDKSPSNLFGRLSDMLTVPSFGSRNNSGSGSEKSESGSEKSKKSKSKKSKSKKSGSKSKKSKSKKSGSKSKKSKGSKS